MPAAFRVAFTLLLIVWSAGAASAQNEIGVVVLHGKWGSPQQGPVVPLVNALISEGFAVSAPEMPWSGARQYDATVEAAESEIDAAIERLRASGAKSVFVAGHSLGAAVALHYASRAKLAGIVAIAPAHRTEVGGFVKAFADDVSRARALISASKGDEIIGFTDRNTGNRRRYLRMKAVAFASYFDPAGPLNMTRNAESLGADVPLLWLVPAREEQPQRDGVVALYGTIPKNPATQFREPDADHLGAPAASAWTIIEWIRGVAGKN
jgi:pimeloyl-ACP methyl ester carboxylesterase